MRFKPTYFYRAGLRCLQVDLALKEVSPQADLLSKEQWDLFKPVIEWLILNKLNNNE